MEIPKPVPVGALASLLARSKQVMEKVETNKPIKQSGNDNGLVESYSQEPSYKKEEHYGYDEADEKDMSYGDYKAPTSDPTHISDYTDEQVMSSNLPQAIKEAMLKNRIPRLQGPPSKVTTEAISKLTGIKPKAQEQSKPKAMPLHETANSNMITISHEQLQSMIQEGISKFFREDYEKRITESAIKKTINVLIKEGKLSVKK